MKTFSIILLSALYNIEQQLICGISTFAYFITLCDYENCEKPFMIYFFACFFLLSLSIKYFIFPARMFGFTRCSLYHRQLASDKFRSSAQRFKIKLNQKRGWIIGWLWAATGFLVIAEIKSNAQQHTAHGQQWWTVN